MIFSFLSEIEVSYFEFDIFCHVKLKQHYFSSKYIYLFSFNLLSCLQKSPHDYMCTVLGTTVTVLATYYVLGRKNFPLPFRGSFSWSNNQKSTWDINRRETKFNFVHTDVQWQKGKMRYVCHPERRNGAWDLQGQEDHSQDKKKKKNRCLVIRCLPWCTDASLKSKLIFGNNSHSGEDPPNLNTPIPSIP